MNAISPSLLDPVILDELRRRQMLAQKAGIMVGQNGGMAKPAPAVNAPMADPVKAQTAQLPVQSPVPRQGFGNSGARVGGDRETLTQWLKRQNGDKPQLQFGGASLPIGTLGGAGMDRLVTTKTEHDFAPERGTAGPQPKGVVPAQPTSPSELGALRAADANAEYTDRASSRTSGGLLSRLTGGSSSFLPDDFSDRAAALLDGWAQGETTGDSIRLGAANLSDYRRESRKERKEAAALNATRQFAVKAGVPAEIAEVMSASDLSQFIGQDWQKRREREQTDTQGNKTRQLALKMGIDPNIASSAPIEVVVNLIEQAMKPGEQFTLSQGQQRFDAAGKPLASVPAEPEKPDGKTLVSPDGKSTRSFDVSTQQGAYAYRRYIDLGWTERQGSSTTVNLGSAPSKSVFDYMADRTGEATSAARSLPSFATARKALSDGSITGFAADQRLFLSKLGTLMGLPNDAVANTETLRASLAPQVLALVKGLGAGTSISNADREFAEKAAGGTISLDETSIQRLMDIGERAARDRIEQHNQMLDRAYPSNDPANAQPRALFSVQMPDLPKPEVPSTDNASIDALMAEQKRRRRMKQQQIPLGGR